MNGSEDDLGPIERAARAIAVYTGREALVELLVRVALAVVLTVAMLAILGAIVLVIVGVWV